MKVTYRDQEWEWEGKMLAREAIRKLGLDPEAVLVLVNGELVTPDVLLKEDDEVKLVAVISGGFAFRKGLNRLEV